MFRGASDLGNLPGHEFGPIGRFRQVSSPCGIIWYYRYGDSAAYNQYAMLCAVPKVGPRKMTERSNRVRIRHCL